MRCLQKMLLAPAVASLLAAALPVCQAAAQSLTEAAEKADELEELLVQLRDPELKNWQAVEDEIYRRWSNSGSPAADLLLKRGRDALEAEDYVSAIDHLTALTDHAPDFAEGWNARATAFFLIDEYGLSIADVQTALSLNPRHFGALSGLGLMLEELGDEANALAAYRMAHEVHPHRENIAEAIERLERKVHGTTL